MRSEKVKRIQYLVETLNRASKAYYAEDREIMSNREYDALYDELQLLEEETGIVLANSPTVNVGYEAVEELPKEKHETPMLSLGKTKSREEQGRAQKLAPGETCGFELEAGWTDGGAYLRRRKACKGCYPW